MSGRWFAAGFVAGSTLTFLAVAKVIARSIDTVLQHRLVESKVTVNPPKSGVEAFQDGAAAFADAVQRGLHASDDW